MSLTNDEFHPEMTRLKLKNLTKELFKEAFNKDNSSNDGDRKRCIHKEEKKPTEGEIEYVAHQCVQKFKDKGKLCDS